MKITHPEKYAVSMYTKKGNLKGFVLDYWTLWSKKTDIKIDFIDARWHECIEIVKNSEEHFMGGLFETENRLEYLDFSKPFFRLQTVVLVSKQLPIQSIDEINDPIGVVQGDYVIEYMEKNYSSLKYFLKTFDSHTTLMENVENKKISAFICDIPAWGSYWELLKPPEGFKKLQILFSGDLRAGVKKGNEKLLSDINMGINMISIEEKQRLVRKWKLYVEKSYTSIAIILGILLFISVVFVIYKIQKSKQLIFGRYTKDDLGKIISQGENKKVEFKSSLRWDYQENKPNKKVLGYVVAKTISAFLNSDGGLLFIGVKDDGTLLGLENDYKTFKNKQNKDRFLITMVNVINEYLKEFSHDFIKYYIYSGNDKEICVLKLEKSDLPVYVTNDKQEEEFYIRTGAGCKRLIGSQIGEYIRFHQWGKK